MAKELSAETSALVKAVGILVGECIFGMFGPMLLIPLLSWFELDFPVAVAVGVLIGAGVGYLLANGAQYLYQHRPGITAGRAERSVALGKQAEVHL